MKRRFQVFISSTFQDLQPARQHVSQALLRCNCFPAGMELFPSADEEQFEYIKEVIDQSDYYIVISAGRYGAVEPKTGLSYTELEYDYALLREKPIIRLLHEDPFNELKGQYIEKTAKGKKQLTHFRTKMMASRLVRFWSDPKELGAEVIHGIEDAKLRRPATGWIRADRKDISYDELRDSVMNMSRALGVNSDSMLDKFPMPVMRCNKNLEILYSNPAALHFSEGKFEVGTGLFQFAECESKTKDLVQDLIDRNVRIQEIGSIALDEQTVQFEFQIVQLDDLDRSTLVVLADLTKIKAVEAQFVQSQKMQAIGQLAGGVAHDFNNLLTAIIGHCDFMLKRRDGKETDQDHADLIQVDQNAKRAAALVSQLLAFSRKQTLRPEVQRIDHLVDDLNHLLNRLVGEKVHIEFQKFGSFSARIDKRQFEQVVMNLVVNARDAMPQGGTILIELSICAVQNEEKRGRATLFPGRYVSMKVNDSGVGIRESDLDKIFEPFYSTKKAGEGTGLGLSTAYGIIKQTGGYIFVESKKDAGTTFEVLLPEVVDHSDSHSASFGPEGITTELNMGSHVTPGKAGTLVVAEDEGPVRAFMSRALQEAGFSVLQATSGEEALEVFKQSPLEIDAIVSDIIMPGMDGPSWV